jgi:putative exosortase-associated protein (TIGR04073 family)
MKKLSARILALSVVGLIATWAVADIQCPPGSAYTPIRKLSRGLANIFYSPAEVFHRVERSLREDDGNVAFSYGIVSGLDRMGIRIGYGLYEVVNFRTPMYKRSFRPPYPSDRMCPINGYTEFPPTFGFGNTVVIRTEAW